MVTPHVGVWIETGKHTTEVPKEIVTPHVGVWIETLVTEVISGTSESHLM